MSVFLLTRTYISDIIEAEDPSKRKYIKHLKQEAIAISAAKGIAHIVHLDSEHLVDPRTHPFLLPHDLAYRDNSRRLRYAKRGLRIGMERCLTPAQREQLLLYYYQGVRKSDIARRQCSSCSSVSKSIKSGEAALRGYLELYMGIYDSLERELLQDDTIV